MTVDEMDLVSRALDVTPWRPEAYEQARTMLRAAMAESGPLPEADPAPQAAPLRRRGLSRARDRRRGTLGTRGKVGIGTGIGAVAAGVAVALVATSAPQPAAPAASASRADAVPAVNSKLASLAALIRASDNGPLPGNASLVIGNKTLGGKPIEVVYALYTDKGVMYTGDDKKTLMSAITQPANPADSATYRWAVAARYAASGDLATARVRMINTFPNCYGIGLSAAAQKKLWDQCSAAAEATLREKGVKTPLKQPTGQALQVDIDNDLWVACEDALPWGAGDPQIRAGVLRLISTIPEVTVANSTTDGQPTLTITAGPALFGDGSDQVLTVNARTGIPVSSVESGGGRPTAAETDQVSRVTLADIEAGKF